MGFQAELGPLAELGFLAVPRSSTVGFLAVRRFLAALRARRAAVGGREVP